MEKGQIFEMIVPIEGKVKFYEDGTYKVFKKENKEFVEVDPTSEILQNIILYSSKKVVNVNHFYGYTSSDSVEEIKKIIKKEC